MAAMQTMLGSRQRVRAVQPGRTLLDDGRAPRDRARPTAGATPDEATKALIYRQSRWGFSVEVLAAQFGLSREQSCNHQRGEGEATCWKPSSNS